MTTSTTIPWTEVETDANCPRLGVALGPGTHYGVPCTLNICHADPLRRRAPSDLPLTCQTDWCLSADYQRCPYWQSCTRERISLVQFILRQMRVVVAVCTRALQI